MPTNTLRSTKSCVYWSLLCLLMVSDSIPLDSLDAAQAGCPTGTYSHKIKHNGRHTRGCLCATGSKCIGSKCRQLSAPKNRSMWIHAQCTDCSCTDGGAQKEQLVPLTGDPMLDYTIVRAQLDAYTSQLLFSIEGNSDDFPEEQALYRSHAAAKEVKRICEIGFNMGHSAALWLTSNKAAHVVMFDLWDHSYGAPAESILQARFPGRLTVIKGDSTTTVPAYIAANPGTYCDIVSVDGDHSFPGALADLVNMVKLAQPANAQFQSIGFIDDTPCKKKYCLGPGKAVDELVAMGRITVIKTIGDRTKSYRGISVFRVESLGIRKSSPVMT